MGYDHDHGRGGGGGTRNLEHIYIYIHGWRFSRCDCHPLCIGVMRLSNPVTGLPFAAPFHLIQTVANIW